jgi:hypothetical protein
MNGANRQKYFFAIFSIYVATYIIFLRSKLSGRLVLLCFVLFCFGTDNSAVLTATGQCSRFYSLGPGNV